ncbi:MAG TPA: hypothetical protein PLJ25_01200, partial [Methanothrix sp.]|nr:hypothetical protein [Methanothrix sp.]
MERKILIRLLGLNLGIAAVDIFTFSQAGLGIDLFGASALATAFGSTIIFLSVAGLTYGNYRLLAERESVVPINKIMALQDYIEALN